MTVKKYKVDKGIPVKKVLPPRTIYPFGEMEVGDSFFVPAGDAPIRKLYNAASQYGKRHGKGQKKFAVRSVPSGARVWRIK